MYNVCINVVDIRYLPIERHIMCYKFFLFKNPSHIMFHKIEMVSATKVLYSFHLHWKEERLSIYNRKDNTYTLVCLTNSRLKVNIKTSSLCIVIDISVKIVYVVTQFFKHIIRYDFVIFCSQPLKFLIRVSRHNFRKVAIHTPKHS